jgi:hypothetical protein
VNSPRPRLGTGTSGSSHCDDIDAGAAGLARVLVVGNGDSKYTTNEQEGALREAAQGPVATTSTGSKPPPPARTLSEQPPVQESAATIGALCKCIELEFWTVEQPTHLLCIHARQS